MKFIINKTDILDVLSNIQGLTGHKSNLAITETVLIQTNPDSDGIIKIAATDLETGFIGSFPAKVESQGTIAINGRKIYEIVKEFPSNEININEIENHWVEISNNKVNYHIVGMNPDDFPEIPLIEDISFFKIKSPVFKKMIDQTLSIGVVTDDRRVHINGIYFEKLKNNEQNIIRMVSTDGNRLSLVDYTCPTDSRQVSESAAGESGSGIIIPKKGLMEVSRFLDSEGTVQIGNKDNHFVIKKDTETITIRLLEGEFPEYSEIIDKGDTSIITIDRKMFLNMLKRMSILYSDSYKGVVFNFQKDKLIITATNPDLGESKEDMDIDYKGDEIQTAFNPKFFIDTLNIIDDDNVVLNIIDEQRPCFIEGKEDKQFLSVIMPMRI
ncbi:MAG: DNA polymerase III subunit beta [Thermodesulfobacteriota bacterium]|nr:DNA polymerase III subunit beta [Thermodesulfobacteriota bacterium]